jgi:hypothetical protein
MFAGVKDELFAFDELEMNQFAFIEHKCELEVSCASHEQTQVDVWHGMALAMYL